MTECLPDMPRHIRQAGDLWEGADHPDGPWRPIPAPQPGLPWDPNRRGSNPPPPGNKPAPPASPPAGDLDLRVQRLEAALLDAFRQIDELKRRLDFQYLKLYKLEQSITPENNAIMTDPTPLSPAAQTIVKAFDDRYENCGQWDDDWQEQCLAAAIRAIADQVVPESTEPNRTINAQPEQDVVFIGAWHICNTQRKMRSQLLAIAAELEGPNG